MERDTMFAQESTWLTERLGRFTASEFHRLMKKGKKKDEFFGDGAITYINEVIAEILTGEGKSSGDFKQTEWGQANELDAILSFQQAYKLEVDYYGISAPKFFPYKEMGGGSPDGLIKAMRKCVEVKCPYNSSNHIAYLRASKNDGLLAWFKDEHLDYYTQVQKNMLSTDTDSCFFISYDPRMVDHKHRLFVMTVPPDKDFQDEINLRLDTATSLVKDTLSILSL